MTTKNTVYIATSIDGYIADRNGGLEWLDMVTIPEDTDMGYEQLMEAIDALLMGRKTFETVCGFDVDWPYKKPVFVASNSLNEIPLEYRNKAYLIKGNPAEIVKELHAKGYYQLYIDGGKTIQNFFRADLIDELIVTKIPILLGGGVSLFAELPKPLEFECIKSEVFVGELVQCHYRRKQKAK